MWLYIERRYCSTTIATLTGPAGTLGWYLGTTTIRLNATDNVGGVGYRKPTIRSTTGHGSPYSTTAPINRAEDSRTLFNSISIPTTSGTKKQRSTVSVNIDKTAPEAKISVALHPRRFVSRRHRLTRPDYCQTGCFAGNSLRSSIRPGTHDKLGFSKTFSGKILSYAKLTSVQYDAAQRSLYHLFVLVCMEHCEILPSR